MAEAIGGMAGTLQGSVQGLANRGQSFIDSIIPPETRSKIMAWISKFAAEKPMLAVRHSFPFSPRRCFSPYHKQASKADPPLPSPS